jgi:hypothetical protein
MTHKLWVWGIVIGLSLLAAASPPAVADVQGGAYQGGQADLGGPLLKMDECNSGGSIVDQLICRIL